MGIQGLQCPVSGGLGVPDMSDGSLSTTETRWNIRGRGGSCTRGHCYRGFHSPWYPPDDDHKRSDPLDGACEGSRSFSLYTPISRRPSIVGPPARKGRDRSRGVRRRVDRQTHRGTGFLHEPQGPGTGLEIEVRDVVPPTKELPD